MVRVWFLEDFEIKFKNKNCEVSSPFGEICKNSKKFQKSFFPGAAKNRSQFFYTSLGTLWTENFLLSAGGTMRHIFFRAHQNRVFKKISQIFCHFVSYCKFHDSKIFLIKFSESRLKNLSNDTWFVKRASVGPEKLQVKIDLS